MKKITLYLAAALLAFAACDKEQPILDNNAEGNAFTLTATIDGFTRVTIADPSDPGASETLAATWNSGDQIAVHTKNGALAVLTTTDSGTTATFTGDVPAGDEIEDGAVIYYPAAIAVAGNAATVNMPDSYASALAASKGVALVAEYSTVSDVTFHHMGAMLKITATDVPDAVTSIVLSANKGISGSLTVDSGSIVGGSCASNITIATTSSARTSGTAELYFPLPVVTLDGFSIDFIKGSDVIAKQSTTKSRSYAKAEYVVMKSFVVDYECPAWIIGGVGEWDPGNGTNLYAVPGHPHWYAAKNITLTTNFKFNNRNSTSWDPTDPLNLGYTGSDRKEFPKNKIVSLSQNGNSITPKTLNVAYDVYLNIETKKFCILEAGAPFGPKLYIIDLNSQNKFAEHFGTDSNFYLHIWNGNGDITSWQNHKNSGLTTINGIQYIVFDFSLDGGDFLPEGSYNMIFGNIDKGNRWEVRNFDFVYSGEDSIGVYFYQEGWSNENTGNIVYFYTFEDLSNPGLAISTNGTLAGSMTTPAWADGELPLFWDGKYCSAKGITLDKDITYAFKFRWNHTWDDNYGVPEVNSSTVYTNGNAIPVTNAGGQKDVQLKVTTSGTYDFYFNTQTLNAFVVAAGEVPTE